VSQDDDKINAKKSQRLLLDNEDVNSAKRNEDVDVKRRKEKKTKKEKKSKKSKKNKKDKKSKKESHSKKEAKNPSSSDSDDDSDDDVPRSIITGKKIKMHRDVTMQDRLDEIERAAKRHFMNTQY
jgi:hypothetical protein